MARRWTTPSGFLFLGRTLMKRLLIVLLTALVIPIAARAPAFAQGAGEAGSLAGLWDAAVVVNGLEIPFRFEIAGSGSNVSGWFFNGEEKVLSTGGKFENGSLAL